MCKDKNVIVDVSVSVKIAHLSFKNTCVLYLSYTHSFSFLTLEFTLHLHFL